MHVQLLLSLSALQRMLQIRLLTEFRPIDEPILYQGSPCYLDGFEIFDIKILASPRPQDFVLNNLNGTETEVVPVLPPFSMTPVMASLSANVVLSPVSAVQAARLVEAPAVQPGVDRYPLPARPPELRIPILGAQFDMFFTVSPHGLPELHVALQELPGADQLGNAQAFLAKFNDLSLPFPVGAAFADVLTPKRTRVLNAGLRLFESEGVIMRFEFEPVQSGSANDIKRQHEWFDFFNAPLAFELNGKDWAIDVPTAQMAKEAAQSVDDQFKNSKIAKVIPGGGASVDYFPGWPGNPVLPQGPGFTLSKEVVIESACAGLDVRATIEAIILLSVPAPNTLRVDGTIDIDLDDWDALKCAGVSLINPFAGLITTFDWGWPWWAVFPVSIAMPLTIVGLIGFGLIDDVLAKEAIDEAKANAKKGQPVIVRTSMTTFYADVQKQLVTEVTRDWLVINEVRGAGDRLILGGDFTAPDIKTLPRLRGTLADPFEYWSKKNRCSTNPQYYTTAIISLGMEDAVEKTPIYKPVIPIRYGIDIEVVAGQPKEVGEVTWRIIDDPAGVYRGPKTRVHWTGVPGVFEVEVDQPPDPFASSPYPFRMQLFTSYGVREFEIPAPPPVPRRPATQQEVILAEAERISECYVFSSLFHIVKALQVHWLPMPQPGHKVGQHWQAFVRGLGPEDRLLAWNVDTGDLLAEVRPYAEGLAEVSLVLPPETPMRTLQLTLNDEPLLSEKRYAAAARKIEKRQEAGPNPTFVRQTPLHFVTQFELAEMASAVAANAGAHDLRIQLNGREGSSLMQLDPLNPGYRPRLTRIEGAAPLIAQVPSKFHSVRQSMREGKQEIEIVGPGISGDEIIVARYMSRPWYDRGCLVGRFFLQLSQDGLTLSLYRRGITQHVEPDVGAPRGTRLN